MTKYLPISKKRDVCVSKSLNSEFTLHTWPEYPMYVHIKRLQMIKAILHFFDAILKGLQMFYRQNTVTL